MTQFAILGACIKKRPPTIVAPTELNLGWQILLQRFSSSGAITFCGVPYLIYLFPYTHIPNPPISFPPFLWLYQVDRPGCKLLRGPRVNVGV